MGMRRVSGCAFCRTGIELSKACEDSKLFIAGQVRLPELFFSEYPVNDDDHCYHELGSVEATEDEADDVHGRSIGELAAEFVRAGMEWRVYAR
jgi:hypothetical protein